MYVFFCVVISAVVSFLVLLILAKLKILDLIGRIGGCGTSGFFRLIIVVVIFCWNFFLMYGILDPGGPEDCYLTTKSILNYYEKIEKDPYGTQTGKLKSDTVLKAIYRTRKGKITWIEGYVLEDGRAKHIYIVIPEIVDDLRHEKSNGYFTSSETSKSFGQYYKRINRENAAWLKNIQDAFTAELVSNKIRVNHSSNNILYESIKKTHKILDKEGYFGLYASKDGDFYYIKKTDSKTFKKLVSLYKKRYSAGVKKYF